MFERRSYQKELLDGELFGKEHLFQNLKELDYINTHLGGHRISIRGIKKIMLDKSRKYNLIDIGCGGGDSLRAIAGWAEKNGFDLSLTGVDLLEDCIGYARESCKRYPHIVFNCADFRELVFPSERINIVHASLFCHHFNEEEISEFVSFCSRAGAIFIINDLERNVMAYYSIKWLTSFFSKSHMVKNDAPLSVLRGFKKSEWQSVLKIAGIRNYVIENRWAFRHLLIIYPNE